ncbi:MAG TPA: energy transducer TonB [Candidatus Krumholzibacteria bacterium]|nr:energy transducer TonB [Candidatus Krumholzibacteria bacterium]HPD71350.1 energy transducer TonB [Candidatus Krumholzibacteria bacterium]HRY38950.1 energy transducer TonB [Candidatus Krumholzibacteria bacterium]
MTTETGKQYALSANAEFKSQYQKTLRWSLVIAIILTIITWFVVPQIRFTPYKLRTEELEIVDIEDKTEAIDLPPPPTEAPPPPKIIEAAPDDAVTEDVDIADTFVDFNQALTSGMGDFGQFDTGDTFVPSQEKPTLKPGGYVTPEYPEMARLSQMQGTVVVKILVGPNGDVLDAQIVKGIHPLLDREALKAARKTRWNPGKQRNIPVKCWMALPYNFKLN